MSSGKNRCTGQGSYAVPEEHERNEIREKLVAWYERVKRDLPWRRNTEPYRVWVSEIMLQQTRVETVIPYYERFMKWFPTVEALAQATEDKLYKAWEGLGYYSRVRNMQKAARKIVDLHQGLFPETYKDILALPGIGPYTAGAVSSIAFSKPRAAVDGNVLRVYARLFAIHDPINQPRVRKQFEVLGECLVDPDRPSSYNQGLMELGATICVPKQPKCMICPLAEHCHAREQSIQLDLPKKEPKKKQKRLTMLAIWLERSDKHLLVKRPADGVLSNMWALPSIAREESAGTDEDQLRAYLLEEFGLVCENMVFVGKAKHVFTHVIWEFQVYKAKWVEGDTPAFPQCQWTDEDLRGTLALPTAFKKVLEVVEK